MTDIEKKRIQLLKSVKAQELFRQVKKYADAGSTAKSLDELKSSELIIYKLMNEIKKLLESI